MAKSRVPCSIDGCNNLATTRGWCQKHYKRWRAHNNPLFLLKDPDRKCSVDGCDGKHYGNGFCAKHNARMARRGTLDAKPKAKNGEPYQAIVDLVKSKPWPEECVLWQWTKANYGYGEVVIDGKKRQAHCVACELAHGPAPKGKNDACHSCGNRLCYNPYHLRWDTRRGNMDDTIIHGTKLLGSQCNGAKLTEDQVREIRSLRGTLVQREIAEIFGVTASAISGIFTGKNWSWLKDEGDENVSE